MSLKYDRVEYLSSQLDIADAIEDLKNGKRHAKRNLYKFVYYRRMNKQDYKEIVKRYNRSNIPKKIICLRNFTAIIFFFSIITAISIILDAIKKPNYLITGTVAYLLLTFFLYHYSNTSNIENKDIEVANLKQEIKKLENIKENDKLVIKLLEKELETIKNNTQEN